MSNRDKAANRSGVDLTKGVKNASGEYLVALKPGQNLKQLERDGKEPETVTASLANLLCDALDASYLIEARDGGPPNSVKSLRGMLVNKIRENPKNVDIKTEHIGTIKELVTRFYSPSQAIVIRRALDPTDRPEDAV